MTWIYFAGTANENQLAGKALLSTTSPQRLAATGKHIGKLDLDNELWTDVELLRLLPHLYRLDHLAIYTVTNITDTSFQHLPRHCKHLKSLLWSCDRLTRVSISADGVRRLVRRCRRERMESTTIATATAIIVPPSSLDSGFYFSVVYY